MILTAQKTRLGKRLKALFAEIPQNCHYFYDLCCDHGALGRAVLESNPHTHVVFNDINPGITHSLQLDLKRYPNQNHSIVTDEAGNVPVNNVQSPVFILAGVGSDQCIKTLERLIDKTQNQNAVFIISPANKVAYVRHFLSSKSVTLINETTIFENNRSYEIIVVRTEKTQGLKVSLTGQCWQATSEHKHHIKKMVDFYTAQTRSSNNPVIPLIAKSYKTILKKITKNT